MAFLVFADGTANLPKSMLDGIELLPCEYLVDDVPQVYQGDVDSFDGHSYYEGLRNGKNVRTSLLNTQLFLTRFSPLLEQGNDIIYIAMSSGPVIIFLIVLGLFSIGLFLLLYFLPREVPLAFIVW